MNGLSFVKYQKWNPTAMACIWAKRNMLDPAQKAHIQALYDNAKEHNRYNVSTFTYSFLQKSAISRAGYGRLYSQENGSIEKLEKSLRHALYAGLCFDADLVNTQPTIFSQMAAKRGLKLKHLTYLEKNRSELIKHFMSEFNMTKSAVKELFIKCLFGSNVPELKPLQIELQSLFEKLREDFSELYELVVKTKDKNVKGAFLAYVAQTEECRCLLAMNDFFTKHNREVTGFCYDGCTIAALEGETVFPDALLRACEKYIKNATGYNMQLVIKDMKCPEEFNDSSAKLLELKDVTDVYMTGKFLSIMNGRIINDTDMGVIVFQNETGLWSNDPNDIRKEIIKANLVEETIQGKVDYSGFLHKQDIIIKLLPGFPGFLPTAFCESHIDKTIGKLLFKDGIYDMPSKTFTKGFNKNLYFAGRIDRDFPTSRNNELISTLNKLLFHDPFLESEQDVGVYQKQLIARAIAGHYSDRFMIWAIGETSSGKGVQCEALLKCFGSFVSIYAPNCLLYNKNSGADEAKKLSWVVPIHNSRISLGNETRQVKDMPMDTSILKNLVSGGDMLPMRQNFKDEEYKKNRSTLMYFCNDMPSFSCLDNAVINRIKMYEYKLSFVDKPEEELEPWERKSFPIKELFNDHEYQNAYFWIIMDAYCSSIPHAPSAAVASAKEWIPAPRTSILSALQNAGYKIVKGADTAFVPFYEIKLVLKEAGVTDGMSDTAIGRELSKLGLELCIAKVNGKSISVRKFLIKE
jgi:hypothetical protein